MKSVEYPARYAARKRSAQRVAFLLFRFLSLFVAFILFAILGFIIYKGAGVLSWDFLTEAPSDGMTSGGIFPAIVGTLYLMLGSAIVAFPIGIMSGIYMSEFASKGWVVKLIRHMTNNLSGVPSIVFGLFGMALFVKYLNFGDSILAGSLTLGLLSLPLVIRTTEEALKDIPDSMQIADNMESDIAHGHAAHYYGAYPLTGTGLGRDGSHPLYLCGLFLPAAACVDIRPVYGIALPPLCLIDKRNRHGGTAAYRLWNGPGLNHNYPYYKFAVGRFAAVFRE